MENIKKQLNILKRVGMGIVYFLGGCIALSILVVLFFAIVTPLLFKPIEIVNDTNHSYKISLFGSQDISDSGYFLEKGFELGQNKSRTFRQRIDCVMVEDTVSHTTSSFDVSRMDDGGKNGTFYLSKILADSPKCWDIQKLEVGKLYHCNKEECY
jgi:hypothetical protein